MRSIIIMRHYYNYFAKQSIDYYYYLVSTILFTRVIYSSYFYSFHARNVIVTTILYLRVINFLFISAGSAGY